MGYLRVREETGRWAVRFEKWLNHGVASKRPPRRDVALSLQQLAFLLKASVPLAKSLDTIAEQQQDAAMQSIMEFVSASVTTGHSLSLSLRKFPDVFPAVVVLLVRTGEQTGTLDVRLEDAGNWLARELELVQRLKKALAGPALTLFVAFAITLALSKLVIPKMAVMYTGMNVPLPMVTRAVLFGAAVAGHPLTWLAAIGSALFVARRWGVIREAAFRVAVRLPGSSRLVGTMLCSQFCDTLGSMVNQGVPIAQALQLLADNAPFKLHQEKLNEVCQRLQWDGDLVKAVGLVPYFPNLLRQMASVSQEGGNLADFLHFTGKLMSDEVESVIENFLRMLEPLLIAALGCFCGLTLVGLFLPLYSLLSQL